MAQLAMTKMRRKIPDLTEALTGHIDEHHSLLVGQLLERLEHTEGALKKHDAHPTHEMSHGLTSSSFCRPSRASGS